jgi:hypothetical protein
MVMMIQTSFDLEMQKNELIEAVEVHRWHLLLSKVSTKLADRIETMTKMKKTMMLLNRLSY